MFNPDTVLKALPSLWRDSFQDKELLELLYGFLGTYLGDVYQSVLEELTSVSLINTPLNRTKTWKALELTSNSKIDVPATSSGGLSLTVYGLLEVDETLESCSRIYTSPLVGSADYLCNTLDYTIIEGNSSEAKALTARLGRSNFFNRFERFIVFFGHDPMLHATVLEPNSGSLYYPLVFEVEKVSLTAIEIAALDKGLEVSLTCDGESWSAEVIFVEDKGDYYAVGLGEAALRVGIEEEVVHISGITAQPLIANMVGGYELTRDIIRLWAYDCQVDQFQLNRKYRHIIGSKDLYIKSTKRYQNILDIFLKARMSSLDAQLLGYLGDVLSGSETLQSSHLMDTLLDIDLVTNRLTSELTVYDLVPRGPIDFRVMNSIQSITTGDEIVPKAQLKEVRLIKDHTFKVIGKLLAGGGTLTLERFDNNAVGTILCLTNRNSCVVHLNTDDLTHTNPLRVYYADSTYLEIPLGEVTVSPLESAYPLEVGTPINSFIYVEDFNTSPSWWKDVGLVLPQSIWDTTPHHRRELTTTKWTCVVGEMPKHLIGDYRLHIPEVPLVALFPVHETSYLLTDDLLRTKIASIRSRLFNGGSHIGELENASSTLIDLSKRLLPLYEEGFLDSVAAASDSLEIAIEVVLASEELYAAQSAGIGEVEYTLAIELATPLTVDASEIVNITFAPFGEFIATHYETVALGYRYPTLLLGLPTFEALVNIGTEVYLNNAALNLDHPGTVSYTTNHIGSESLFMVVGASYPEYTKYYDFTGNTLAAHLDIYIEPPIPNSSDSFGAGTDSLDTQVT